MKIRPTPIVPAGAAQQRAEGQPKKIAPTIEPEPKKPESPALEIHLGEKKIELQRGELARIIDKMNETVRIFNHSIRFEMAEDEIHIKVIDTVSGHVVRQIPPEKLMDAFTRMEDIIGLLLDLRI